MFLGFGLLLIAPVLAIIIFMYMPFLVYEKLYQIYEYISRNDESNKTIGKRKWVAKIIILIPSVIIGLINIKIFLWFFGPVFMNLAKTIVGFFK